MGFSTDLATKQAAPAWARRYFGTPFVDRGMTLNGCDCYGLVYLVCLRERGVKLPAYPELARGATLAKMRKILTEATGPEWTEIPAGSERSFDLVLMRGQFEHDGRKHSRPIHTGIVVAPGMLMHIEEGSEVTVADYRQHPRLRHRVTGFYRHRKLP